MQNSELIDIIVKQIFENENFRQKLGELVMEPKREYFSYPESVTFKIDDINNHPDMQKYVTNCEVEISQKHDYITYKFYLYEDDELVKIAEFTRNLSGRMDSLSEYIEECRYNQCCRRPSKCMQNNKLFTLTDHYNCAMISGISFDLSRIANHFMTNSISTSSISTTTMSNNICGLYTKERIHYSALNKTKFKSIVKADELLDLDYFFYIYKTNPLKFMLLDDETFVLVDKQGIVHEIVAKDSINL